MLSATVIGAPARKSPLTVTQPDGTQLTVVLMGDEFFHYYVTADGIPVRMGDDGFYHYVASDATTLTGVVARDAAARSADEQALVASIDKDAIFADFDERNKVMRSKRKSFAEPAVRKSVKADGEVHGLIILVNFRDTKFVTEVSEIEAMMNSEGYSKYGSIGSARDYFIDQSGGKFSPTFDIVGPVDLPQDMDYYGANDSRGNDAHPDRMVSQACIAAGRLSGVDFSKYDLDGDGVLDLAYLIYAGYNEAEGADGNTVWSHAAHLTDFGLNTRVDGVLVDAYACSSELTGRGPSSGKKPAGIGTFCHEYSHTLGLPDFYNTKDADDFTMDTWSVMDYGMYNGDGYVPVGYSSYERELCGWITIRDLGMAPQTVTLANAATSYDACKIVNENDHDEFFVFESRAKQGWDKHLAASGLMITSVAYDENIWERNIVNNSAKKRVFVVAADNIYTEHTLAGDLYPYNGNNSFTSTSTPAMRTYSNDLLDRPVTNITKDDAAQTVTFDYLGGDANAVASPVALPATEVAESSFVANWETVDGVDSYNLVLSFTIDGQNGSRTYRNLSGSSYRVENLVENIDYQYCVVAVKGGYESAPSNAIAVSLGSGMGETSGNASYVYAQDGAICVASGEGLPVEVYHVSGSKVAEAVSGASVTVIPVDGVGMYVVRVGDDVRKVVVR